MGTTTKPRSSLERDLGARLVLRGEPFLTDGFVLPVDKPRGVSSFSVVRAAKRITGGRKVGHAGTLDPMATGLLVVLVGAATRTSATITGWPKRYTGVIRLGQTTASYDAETPVESVVDTSGISDEMIREASRQFIGTIRQLTPAYSAVRIHGERSYRKARRGEVVPRPPRIVTVTAFELEDRVDSDVRFVLDCSVGTYVRSIAHDLGMALGVGAHLIELRRERVGALHVDDATPLRELDRGSNEEV